MESRFLSNGDPTPGEGGRPGAPSEEGGGGDEPRMEFRMEFPLGEAARMVVVVGIEGELGAARLVDDPLGAERVEAVLIAWEDWRDLGNGVPSKEFWVWMNGRAG